ncbi:hypothetical protein F444_05235 [Phytophthora nicotianae P1976]|uniref:FHA domain-containing protein n=1 Tax=Phytophthora nicotianae P1976 TaxID=1317066 RepID=A0A081AMT1_PHYNI|nr:hypothetical protein F444_05235 [Phytophthora nicotianae P1976]
MDEGTNGVYSAPTPLRPFMDGGALSTDANSNRKRRVEVLGGLAPSVTRAPPGSLGSPAVRAASNGPSVLQMFTADNSGSRLGNSFSLSSSTSTLSSSWGVRTSRDPEQEPEFNMSASLPNKRSRLVSYTLPGSVMMNGAPDNRVTTSSSFGRDSRAFDNREEQFETMKEDSQNLMEAMSISQQNTQECTQTLEDSPSLCLMRLVLHPEVDKAVTAFQKNALEKKGLYRIEMQMLTPRVTLGRESYVGIFDKKTSGVDPVKLSRTHCIIETALDPETHRHAVFITDKSTNGIRIDGVQVQKNKKYKLADGQKITLLSSRQGNVLLGYVAEDPHVRGAQEGTKGNQTAILADSQDKSQQGPNFQEYTLGVLFSAPLVGKDIHGKYHPIAELDVKREYSILQKSLIEASKFAKRPAAVNDLSGNNGPGTLSRIYQCPRQISVVAKFANTDTFRAMVTLGCRALHFSGHGDENHLYFEDGMGLVHPIPHKGLQELFSAGGGGESTLRLVFVSACSSAPLAYAFVACGIPHVIGVRTNQKIEDYAAIEFTRAFYLALATGKPVGASFTIAQQSVAKSPNIRGPMAVAGKFMLLPEDGDHSEIIFPLAAVESSNTINLEPMKKKRYPKLWFDDLPAMCQGFCNRSVEVYKICLALMMTQSRITRLVTICGEEGIGKTAVAHAVANYVGPRITSEGGVRIFSVARLAQDEMDEHVGMMRRNINIANGRCRVLTRLETMVTDHLKQHKARIEFNGQHMLMVMDGCDYLLRNDTRRDRFRVFLSDILTNNASLKIVLTARTSICADGAVRGHGERLYTLSKFDMKSATMMLVSLMSRPIRVEELKHARATNSTDKLELIASHPALRATKGIPKRIADLAGRLNETTMDKIQVDESDLGLME